MNPQRLLFDPGGAPDELDPGIARSRSHDPEPAKEAARAMNASGTAKRHLDLVLRVLRNAAEPLTAAEVGAWTQLGHVPAQRRLSDACALGLVVKSAARVCRMNGRRMTTWEAT